VKEQQNEALSVRMRKVGEVGVFKSSDLLEGLRLAIRDGIELRNVPGFDIKVDSSAQIIPSSEL